MRLYPTVLCDAASLLRSLWWTKKGRVSPACICFLLFDCLLFFSTHHLPHPSPFIRKTQAVVSAAFNVFSLVLRALPEPAPYSVTAPNITGRNVQKQEIVPQIERFFVAVPNKQQGNAGGERFVPRCSAPVVDHRAAVERPGILSVPVATRLRAAGMVSMPTGLV